MVLVLRSTALRISDVATLQKDAVSWDQENSTWRVRLRTQKSGEPVYLPIPEIVKLALDALPLPRNAPQDCRSISGMATPPDGRWWESPSGPWRPCSRSRE